MICRSKDRAETARKEIVDSLSLSDSSKVEVLIADVSKSMDVKNAVKKLEDENVALDCLVCNAGALLSKKIMTDEGMEITFASHTAIGTYLLTKLALPLLRKSPDPRVVVVSSGGKFQKYDDM